MFTPIKFTAALTSAAVAITVVAAHAVIGTQAASSLQRAANVAVLPHMSAERIEVRPMQVVKAEKITVVAAKPLQIVKAEKITVTARQIASV